MAVTRKAPFQTGWVIGAIVACVAVVAFVALFREDHHLMDELLLVGIPIGVAIGVMIGLAVEGPALSRKRRNTIGWSMVIGFLLYVGVLVAFLASRV